MRSEQFIKQFTPDLAEEKFFMDGEVLDALLALQEPEKLADIPIGSQKTEISPIEVSLPIVPEKKKESYWKTRIFSFLALAGLISGCGYVGREGYYIITDGFAAPFILTPDNDLVVENRLKLAQVQMEKLRDISIQESSEAVIQAGDKALVELNDFKRVGIKALAYPSTTTAQQAVASTVDISNLDREKQMLIEMQRRQAKFVNQAQNNLNAGLIQKPEFEREQQALDQINLASVENQRIKVEIALLQQQAQMGQGSFYHGKDGSLPRPEVVMSEYQLTLVDNQILQTQALTRTAQAEKDRASKELSDIDVLEKQIKSRPIFQAITHNINAAFVPYSQSNEVTSGTPVYDCIWALFHCTKVGSVKDIIEGETILQNPMSNEQERGIYVTLDVSNRESMQSKILRLRHK